MFRGSHQVSPRLLKGYYTAEARWARPGPSSSPVSLSFSPTPHLALFPQGSGMGAGWEPSQVSGGWGGGLGSQALEGRAGWMIPGWGPDRELSGLLFLVGSKVLHPHPKPTRFMVYSPTGPPAQNGYGTGRGGARILWAARTRGVPRASLDPGLLLRHWRGREAPEAG